MLVNTEPSVYRGNSPYRPLAWLMTLISFATFGPNFAFAARPTPGSIGINLYSLYSSGEQIPFVDVFKMSSPWTSSVKGHKVKIDSNGWVSSLDPGEYAETTIFTNSTGHYPAGLYTVTYDGKGILNVGGAGVTVTSSAPGRMILQVQPIGGVPNNGIQFRETSLDPAAPIRNIHVFLPGYSTEPKGNPFNPAFLALLRPFKVIRFIGWANINRCDTTSWSDERPANYATQASILGVAHAQGGVSLEYQVELANLLHADPWFLVPLKADDNYLRNMATIVRDRLDPSLHPYVELSNEVWNAGFPEASFARQMGQGLGLDPDASTAGAKWYSMQSVHAFDVWTQVFGADASRIVRVMGSSYSLPPLDATVLGYQDAYKHVDVLAIAPYIMPKTLLTDYDAIAKMTPDQVLDQVEADVSGKVHDFIGYHLARAKKFDVDLVAYEGGPALLSFHAPPALLPQITETMRVAAESPRMAAIYRELLDEWFNSGGALYMHFDDVSPANAWGDMGLVSFQTQDLKTSLRFQMYSSYIQANGKALRHTP